MNRGIPETPLERWLLHPVLCLLIYVGTFLVCFGCVASAIHFLFYRKVPPNYGPPEIFFFGMYYGFMFGTLTVALMPILAVTVRRGPFFSLGTAAFLGAFMALGIVALAPLDLDQTSGFGFCTVLGTGVFLLGFAIWFLKQRRTNDRSNQRLQRTPLRGSAEP